MSVKIKAVERNISFSKDNVEYGYVLSTEMYNRLSDEKVIAEASAHSGISQAILKASCAAVADVLMSWISEGHSVSIPYLGTMRFGLNSKAVSTVGEVGTDLITSRKVVFTPSGEIKDALANTSFSITCYDRNGKVVKRVNAGGNGVDTDDEGNEAVDPDGPNNDNGGTSGGGGFAG